MKERFLFPSDAIPPSSLPIREISDRAFEIAVFEAAKREITKAGVAEPTTKVELTPPSADRGRDVIIHNYSPANFFGLDLGRDGIRKTLFVECKLTGKRRLTLEHVAANVLQIEPKEGSIFVLITNATLTPRATCIIERQCRRLGVAFLLIDAWNMMDCLPTLVSEANKDTVRQSNTLVSYQVLKNGQLRNQHTVHFLIRSAPSHTLDYNLSLHSTRDWNGTAQDPESQNLDGGNLGCWSIDITPKGLKTPRSLTVSLMINGGRTLHEIPLVSGDEIARLPLFASQMVQELATLKSQLSSHNLPRLVHIHGKAGSGKSRLLLELFDEAQFQGLACRYITISDNGGLFVSTSGFGERDKVGVQETQISDFFQRMSRIETGGRDELILVDDVHKASAPVLQEIATFAFGSTEGISLVVAGRSDPTFRRPDYEAFDRQMSEHQSSGNISQIVLGEMSDTDVRAALDSIFKEETPGLLGLKEGNTQLRPVDLVHAVHSLLERNQIQWADEERLTLSVANDAATDYFSGDDVIGGILGFRYDHLTRTTFEKFNLAGLFEVLAVIDEPEQSYVSIKKLLEQTDVAQELVMLWFDIDDTSERATFRHGSLKDFLHSKFYSFDTAPQCREVLTFAGLAPSTLRPEINAAFAFSDGDLNNARALISAFAQRLRVVTNVSSLNLNEADYPHLATLFAILQSASSIRPLLQHRCLVARAYLNSHHRAYALGFIDNLRLVGLVSALPDHSTKGLTVAGVKQLMAHALINSGDAKTALSLMHEVENFLERHEKSKSARAIEFDMCDRLQSYYAAQSAFSSARLFFLRARSCAHFVGSPALLSLSFSAEFHLSRYLDVENAARLSERQLKHAERGVPERTLFHAKVNDLVSNWALDETSPEDTLTAEFQRLRAICRHSGFGHLVPRLDYLLAVDALLRWRRGDHSVEFVDTSIAKANESARRYGYSEYIWLLASLDLIRHVEAGSAQDTIVQKGAWLIDHLHDQGLTFIAGDELCFQNTVAISNALRAIHQNTDQETAWRYAQKISFSPLFIPKPSEQRQRIETLFKGKMLNHVYDPRALVRDNAGYAIILV